MLLEELLSLSGHTAIAAGSAADAYQRLADNTERSPDLALIDMSLPDATGCDVARRLRQDMGGDIRLIALTGYSDPETREAAQQAGFDEYVVKPLMTDTLDALLAGP
jgi:CheY-like chemotaxis protein